MAYTVTELVSYDNKRNKVTLDNGKGAFLLYKGECRRLGITVNTHGTFGTETVDADGSKPQATANISGAEAKISLGGASVRPAAAHGLPTITDTQYREIMDGILLPRAKKRVMYFLKNGDRSRAEILSKLKQGLYPDEVIERTFEFLDKYNFADDTRYAEGRIESLKGVKSRREIEAKLYEKGIRGEKLKEILDESIDAGDEYAACERALRKKYGGSISHGEKYGSSMSSDEKSGGGMPRDERRRAYAYLARKGFSYDAIEHAFNTVCERQLFTEG